MIQEDQHGLRTCNSLFVEDSAYIVSSHMTSMPKANMFCQWIFHSNLNSWQYESQDALIAP